MVKAGYKQTEVGEIPEDWEATPLGALLRIKHGKSQKLVESSDGDYPILATGGEIGRAKDPLYSKPSVLIGRKGTIDVPYYMDTPFWTVDTLFYSEISYRADAKFMFYKFQLIDWYKYNEASGVPSLSATTIEKIIQATPKERFEQEAIANTLSDVDALIVSLEKLIEKKRDIKTATMQQLLTGKKRLPGFGDGKATKQSELGEIPEDWDEIPLSDVGYSIIGLTYRPQDMAESGTLVLRSSNIQNSQLVFEDNVHVSTEVPARVIVQAGDLLVCVRNGSKALIGKCALIDEQTAGSAFGAFMTVFRSHSSDFILHQFQSRTIKKQIEEIMGATINQITKKDMASFKIPFPREKNEREAICKILNDMAADIRLLEGKLCKMRAIKQGMMQELLTGRTRLV